MQSVLYQADALYAIGDKFQQADRPCRNMLAFRPYFIVKKKEFTAIEHKLQCFLTGCEFLFQEARKVET